MEDHANRKYRVEMQGRLSILDSIKFWRWDKQTVTRITIYRYSCKR